MLLLHGPHTLFIKELFLLHFCLAHLHLTLVHNFSRLLGIHALEVVGLDAMGSQHGLLSSGVLGHEVVGVGVVDVSLSLKLLVCALSKITVPLLLRHLHVGIFDRLFHVDAVLCVLVLCTSQELMEVELLVIVDLLRESLLLLEEFPLSNLLVNPVFLL